MLLKQLAFDLNIQTRALKDIITGNGLIQKKKSFSLVQIQNAAQEHVNCSLVLLGISNTPENWDELKQQNWKKDTQQTEVGLGKFIEKKNS